MSESRAARYQRITRDFGAALFRVARTYAAPAEQDDLAQVIALAVWNALPRFRDECSERTFVLRIAHNRGLNHLVRRKPVADSAGIADIADPQPSPEARAVQKEEVDRLFTAVRALPLAYRQVITLAFEELPHAEIATVLGISEDNVAVRLHRARSALRAQLERNPK